MPYRFLIPPGYHSTSKYPLIVFLHGAGETGNDNLSQLKYNGNGVLQLVAGQNQISYPAFMLAPQANPVDGWNDHTLGQTLRAIRALESQYSIDHDRIYVTGLSMGGQGTYRIVSLFPDVFAAAAPLSAYLSISSQNLVGTPIWAFHAADDATVSIGLGDTVVSGIRFAGGRVIYTRYATGGHGIWPTAYATPYFLPWLMAQRRHQPPTGTPIISIKQPANKIPAPTPVNSIDVSGTASFPEIDFHLYWTLSPLDIVHIIDPTLDNSLPGTSSWEIPNLPVGDHISTFFMLFAVGPSWAPASGQPVGGGTTTVNDVVWIVPGIAPAPSVSITNPVASGSWSTAQTSLDLSGGITIAGGALTAGVTWTNDRGGQGIGVLDTNASAWTVHDITLQPGDNIIKVTALDYNNIAGSTTLVVHCAATAAVPSIAAQPQAAFGVAGSSASFYVTPSGAGPFSYQWQKNGIAIAGATSALFTIAQVQANDAGNYTVLVSNSAGSVTSNVATLTVVEAGATGRLRNLSVRAIAASGDQTLIVGFIVSGAGNLPVLIRGWGPTLHQAPFNITDALDDPLLRIFRGASQLGENNDWGGGLILADEFASVGAYAFWAASKDAAIYTSLAPGANTAHILSATASPGVALAELFDATPGAAPSSARLSNVSARAQVGTGDQVLIGGFVVDGPGPANVLIRAVGPGLQQFNVGGLLADPVLELHSSTMLLQTNDNWGDAENINAVNGLNDRVGFILNPGSKDAVIFATLPPGGYTAVIRGTNNTKGVALLEIYEIR